MFYMFHFGLERIHHISHCYLIDFTVKLCTMNGSIITNKSYIGCLAHPGLVTHISADELGHHWFSLWHVACLMTNLYLNQ